MKRLLLMRHAEASCDAPTDLDRPLNERGVAAARSMGVTVAARGFCPQQLISSPAKRAMQTAAVFAESAGLAIEIALDERIYEAIPQTLFGITNRFSDEFETAMIVGHNPGFEGFIALLTGESQQMRAGAIAVINLKAGYWADVKSGVGEQIEMLHP